MHLKSATCFNLIKGTLASNLQPFKRHTGCVYACSATSAKEVLRLKMGRVTAYSKKRFLNLIKECLQFQLTEYSLHLDKQ